MTIQRKYSLPNCTLILEGLSDSTATQPQVRPVLSLLVNAECRLANYQQPLTGGRDFFNSLVVAVSAYAQEFLSQMRNPQAHQSGLVQLQKLGDNRHRLIVQSETPQTGSQAAESHAVQNQTEIDLTTVQLFDLVEAVDQFFADNQTLPDLVLDLKPVSKRYNPANQTIVKQVVPATVGVSGLALAAIAFFLVPIPEVKRPTEPTPQSSSNQSSLEAPLPTAPAITDQSRLVALNQQLFNQLNQGWKTRSLVKQDLAYRVVVNSDGQIVGYRSVSPTASAQIAQTPLPDLLKNPATNATPKQAIANFSVVFTSKGEVQVTPWKQ